MATKILNDYTCFDNNSDMNENDSLQQVLHSEEEKNAPKRKRNVRKAIERHLERKRLQTHIRDNFDINS